MLTDLSEASYFDIFQPGHNFSNKLDNQKFAGSWVAKMRSDRFLAKFLNHDWYKSIEHSRVSEELFNVDLGLALKGVYVVKKINAKVLLDCQVLLFVLNEIIFHFFVRQGRYFAKFYFPCVRECKSVKLIRDSEAFFACHDAIGLVARIVILFNITESFSREHSLEMFFRKHSIAANVWIIVVCQTLSLCILDNSS